jgi:hypothetical protein
MEQKQKTKKKKGSLGRWVPSPTFGKEGARAPPPQRVNDGAHLHPQATKHREKIKKKRELELVMAPTCSQKQQNKKKKGGADLCQKLAMAPTKTKTI